MSDLLEIKELVEQVNKTLGRQEQGSAAWRFLLNPSAAAQTPGLLDGYGQNTDILTDHTSAALFGQLEWKVTDTYGRALFLSLLNTLLVSVLSVVLATFLGLVRAANDGSDVSAMTLEHYPGMTEKALEAIVEDAAARWPLLGVRVIHRFGRLVPGDRIVFVGVAATHRGEAFAACEFIMDYLKTRAPFWKKEDTPEGGRWVDARESDDGAAARWER